MLCVGGRRVERCAAEAISALGRGLRDSCAANEWMLKPDIDDYTYGGDESDAFEALPQWYARSSVIDLCTQPCSSYIALRKDLVKR